jgi:hypothetical protein
MKRFLFWGEDLHPFTKPERARIHIWKTALRRRVHQVLRDATIPDDEKAAWRHRAAMFDDFCGTAAMIRWYKRDGHAQGSYYDKWYDRCSLHGGLSWWPKGLEGFLVMIEGDPEPWIDQAAHDIPAERAASRAAWQQHLITERQVMENRAQERAQKAAQERRARQAYRASLQEWLALTPIQFEHACADLLTYHGYAKAAVTKASGDGGVDIIATVFDGKKVGVQCKRYRHPVGPEEVRALAGVILSDQTFTGGVFITTSSFTQAARQAAARAKLTLIDGRKLTAMGSMCKEPSRDGGQTAIKEMAT